MNRIKKLWTLSKLFYLHTAHWLVGLTEEEFYIMKGNYCTDLRWNSMAIRSYEKARKESKDPRIFSMLGLCYLRIGKYDKSVENYRIAYVKFKHPKVAVGLVITEYETGNIKRSAEIIDNLNTENELDAADEAALKKLRDLIAKSKQNESKISYHTFPSD
jgi:tetratricopeptide (TPR) repeat protein